MEQTVEAICKRGCQYVYALLNDDNSRVECIELNALAPHQQVVIIQELQEVMSVYQQSGGCEV